MTAERGRTSALPADLRLLNCLRTSVPVHPPERGLEKASTEHKNNSAEFSLQIQQVTLKCCTYPQIYFR
jgi:hypothetical protein